MIIDVLKLKQEGKTSYDFAFEYQADNGLLSLPGAEFSGAVKVIGTAFIDGKDLNISFTVNYVLVGECSRCLEPAVAKVNFPFEATFSLFPGEDVFLYKSGKADITPAVNEAILLSQPTVMYCKEDCKGLCPICGNNLNFSDCGHGTLSH